MPWLIKQSVWCCHSQELHSVLSFVRGCTDWETHWQSDGIGGKWKPSTLERVENPGLRKDHSLNLLRKSNLKYLTKVDIIHLLYSFFITVSASSCLFFYTPFTFALTLLPPFFVFWTHTPTLTHTHFFPVTAYFYFQLHLLQIVAINLTSSNQICIK